MSECPHLPLSFANILSVQHNYRSPSEQQLQDGLRVSQPKQKKRRTAQENSQVFTNEANGSEDIGLPLRTTFPPPIVLPRHELALDPKYPPQPVQEWLEADYRNHVTPDRKTIYVAAPPKVPRGLSFVNRWAIPSKAQAKGTSKATQIGLPSPIASPSIEDVLEYLQAFYNGMDVQLLETASLEWMAWDSDTQPRKRKKNRESAKTPDCIGLSTGNEILRVKSRPSPDGIFSGQLNQNHLLEVAIDILPKDAYALLMILNHDLFEDEDDDFCCGRAYGGSRVAVVSTARYRPDLDTKQDIDLQHVWPASHCAIWQGRFYSSKTPAGPPEDKKHCRTASEWHPGSPIAAAVDAHMALPMPSSPADFTSLWLGRICKTASHELGHCFGIDHCVYWACSMQGTASIVEDHRQPPFLCPVDLSKVLRATGANERDRYEAMLRFCDKWRGDRLFAAYGAWIRAVLGNEERS